MNRRMAKASLCTLCKWDAYLSKVGTCVDRRENWSLLNKDEGIEIPCNEKVISEVHLDRDGVLRFH